MGDWNYRLLYHTDQRGDYLGLHEVQYDADGKPCSYAVTMHDEPDWIVAVWSSEEVDVAIKEMRESLMLAATACDRPVLRVEDFPGDDDA